MDKDNKITKLPVTASAKRGNLLLISVAINIAILILVMLLAHLSYETNDDYAISTRLRDGYPYVGFVNYFLCKAIIAIQALMPDVNVFVLSMIACSFAAFVVILHTIFGIGDDRISRGFTVACIAIFAFDHYASLQFTKTAALVMTAGAVSMMCCLIERKGIWHYIGATFLLYLGAAFRFDAFPVVLAFAGLFALARLIARRGKRDITREDKADPKFAALCVAVAVLVAGVAGVEQISMRINMGTPELMVGEEYSDLRSSIVDFPTYENYQDNKDEYDAIGITENDLYLIDKWVFDYDGAASYDNLSQISSIARKNDVNASISGSLKTCLRTVLNSVKKLTSTGIHVIVLTIIAVWMLIRLRPRHWLYIIATGMMVLCIYAALYYIQRANYRAMYAADVSGAFWLLTYMMLESKTSRPANDTRIMEATGIIAIIIILIMIIPMQHVSSSKYESSCNKVMSGEMQEYFTAHKDSFYTWATTEKKFTSSYSHPLAAPDRSDDNVTGTGGWGTMTPYMLNKLNMKGISNPIKDLIDNDNCFYVGNKRIERMEEYYNRWYSDESHIIKMVQVDKIGSNKIWKVIKTAGE